MSRALMMGLTLQEWAFVRAALKIGFDRRPRALTSDQMVIHDELVADADRVVAKIEKRFRW